MAYNSIETGNFSELSIRAQSADCQLGRAGLTLPAPPLPRESKAGRKVWCKREGVFQRGCRNAGGSGGRFALLRSAREACLPEPQLARHSLCEDWPDCPPLPAPQAQDFEFSWQPCLLAPPSAPRCLTGGPSSPRLGCARSSNLAPTLRPSPGARARGCSGPDRAQDASRPRWGCARSAEREAVLSPSF